MLQVHFPIGMKVPYLLASLNILSNMFLLTMQPVIQHHLVSKGVLAIVHTLVYYGGGVALFKQQ